MLRIAISIIGLFVFTVDLKSQSFLLDRSADMLSAGATLGNSVTGLGVSYSHGYNGRFDLGLGVNTTTSFSDVQPVVLGEYFFMKQSKGSFFSLSVGGLVGYHIKESLLTLAPNVTAYFNIPMSNFNLQPFFGFTITRGFSNGLNFGTTYFTAGANFDLQRSDDAHIVLTPAFTFGQSGVVELGACYILPSSKTTQGLGLFDNKDDKQDVENKKSKKDIKREQEANQAETKSNEPKKNNDRNPNPAKDDVATDGNEKTQKNNTQPEKVTKAPSTTPSSNTVKPSDSNIQGNNTAAKPTAPSNQGNNTAAKPTESKEETVNPQTTTPIQNKPNPVQNDEVVNTKDTKPTTVKPTEPVSNTTTRATTKPAETPKTQPVNATTTSKSVDASSGTVTDSGTFFIQVAALNQSSGSIRDFKKALYVGSVYRVKNSSGTKIRVGKFADRASAEKAKELLLSHGFKGAFIVQDERQAGYMLMDNE